MIRDYKKIEVIYRFMGVKGVGFVQTNRLIISTYKANSLDSIENEIKSILEESQFLEFKNSDSILNNLKHKYDVGFISLYEDIYPESLKLILKINTPPILSYIGNLELLQKRKIAFSGSRKVSDKGIVITKEVTKQLIEKDISIVSGYAKGVDFEAHRTALENGGTTIIVLPEGINSFSIKKELKDVWDWNRILVISEFKPDEKWMASRAMQRNNTIIGLSDVVVVIEAGETGGSFDAGLKTLDLKKWLFVPEYGIIPESALGNSILLRKGAFPIRMNRETLKPNLTKMFELLETKDLLF
ncbi:DNA-protecting protein DprA [Bacteroidales bacterium OttesenSCG-928-M06]|nr:DNA-protecting protein DprA [Bacteroidales bacterium OttesenSCG-928-M06]